MSEKTGIIITLEEEDFLVTLGEEEPIKLLVIPVDRAETNDSIAIVEHLDVDTGDKSYSAVIPPHDPESAETWERAIKVAGIVMAQMDVLIERGVLV